MEVQRLYDSPVVFKATVWMDDGQEPIADGGWCQDFESLGAATEWASARVRQAQREEPAPADAPGWYAVVDQGRYERTGTTGFDLFDYDWIDDESAYHEPIYA